MRALFAAGLLFLFGCPLPTDILYRCEGDDTCPLPGFTCAGDRYCHPSAEVLEDGGVLPLDAGVDAGPCVPRDLVAACAATECGFITDGCGVELDCEHACPAPMECGVSTPNRCGLPSLCTPEGWCWENPLPQGFTINASLALDPRHTWFVGEHHLVLFFDGEKSVYQEVPIPPGVDLWAIHGTAPDDVFAVGNQGMILHFNGTDWERESTLSGFNTGLRTVWSLGDGGALAAGPGGKVLSRAALLSPFSRWTLETFPSVEEIRDVFADPAGVIYAVTRRNELFTRAGGSTNWSRLDTVPMTETLAGLPRAGGLTFAGNNVSRANIVHRDPDGGWRAVTDAGFSTFDLVPGDGGVFALSNGTEFAWLDDADGYTRFVVQPGQWNTGAALRGPRLLLGGFAGSTAVSQLDGGLTWRSSPRVPRGHSFNAVCGSSPGAMFAVGGTDATAACASCRARWMERQVTTAGAQWTPKEFQLGSTTQLLACYAEPDRVWMPGNDSKFIQLEAGQPRWGDFGGGAIYGQYSGAWGTADAGYFFTRRENPQLTTSSDGWAPFVMTDVSAAAGLRSVWGLASDDVLVVGLNGATSRFDGVRWNPVNDVAQTEFAAVHGAQQATGERRYVAVGSAGALYSLVGDAGAVTQAGPQVNFSGAWVSARGTAWAVGRAPDGGAFVMKSEPGGPWANEALTSPRPVTGVYGFDLEDGGVTLWLTGPVGMILRKDER